MPSRGRTYCKRVQKLIYNNAIGWYFYRRMSVCLGKRWLRVILKAVTSKTVTIRQASLVNSRQTTLVTATTIKNYLDEKQFDYREGYTCYTLECPICNNTVKKENGASIHINKTTGNVACQPCKMSGMTTTSI